MLSFTSDEEKVRVSISRSKESLCVSEPYRTSDSAAASWTAAVLCRFGKCARPLESSGGLSQSKTWRRSGRFMCGPHAIFSAHWDHEPERGCVQSTNRNTSEGQSPSHRSIALPVAPPPPRLLWTYLLSVRVVSPRDVAPTFLSASWEAFQPPVARQECLPTCRLESRRYELSGRLTHTLDIAALQRRGSWRASTLFPAGNGTVSLRSFVGGDVRRL